MDTTRKDDGRFHEIGDVRTTNDDQKFKRQYQTVDHPQVTDHDIHEEYMRDAPNNLVAQGETRKNRKAFGLKGGAFEEVNPKREGVLGDEPTGRIQKDAALGALANENTVHPNSTL